MPRQRSSPIQSSTGSSNVRAKRVLKARFTQRMAMGSFAFPVASHSGWWTEGMSSAKPMLGWTCGVIPHLRTKQTSSRIWHRLFSSDGMVPFLLSRNSAAVGAGKRQRCGVFFKRMGMSSACLNYPVHTAVLFLMPATPWVTR